MFVIEVKDADGWIDYASHDDFDAAIAQAKALRESFGDNVKVVDIENMVTVYGEG